MARGMRVDLLAVITLVAAWSGCIDTSDDAEPANSPSGSTTDASPTTIAASTTPGASTTPPPGSDPNQPPPPPPTVTVHEGSFVLRGFAGTGPSFGVLDETASVPMDMTLTESGYLVILEWSPASPLTDSIHLVAAPSSQHPDVEITSASPLRLVVPYSDVGPTAYSVKVLPAGVAGTEAGVGVNQDFVMTFVMFVGQPVDPLFVPPA